MSEDLSDLNLVELYDALIPPEVPSPVSMWPQTAAWWWLLAGVLVCLGLAFWYAGKRRRANAYRRAALAELRQAGDDPARVADVLRRTAVAGFGRSRVAPLYGQAWIAFLDETAPGTALSGSEPGTLLASAAYRPAPASPELSARAAHWIKRHRLSGGVR